MALPHDPPGPAVTSSLIVDGITKRFGAFVALDDIRIRFRAGEVHAVLGENGAGKSTLMNVLNGSLVPDGGRLRWDDETLEFRSPVDAHRAGIGMVHQHFTLIDALTVGENLALNFGDHEGWRLDVRRAMAEAEKFAEAIGLQLPQADARVSELPVGSRQRLEILRALAGAGRVLILDEPTAVLTPDEADQLFHVLRRLRGEGRVVIFITHKLSETAAIADRITVLRRGRVAGDGAVGELSASDIARMMVGEDVLESRVGASTREEDGDPVVELAGVSASVSHHGRALRSIDLQIGPGEILGVAGVDGNGQSELFELLSGVRHVEAGAYRLEGEEVGKYDPAQLLAAGLATIPPDRHRHGLVLAMSVAENSVLSRPLLQRFKRRGLLDADAIADFAKEIVTRFDVRLPSVDAPASALSGGNQQRVIIGRALLSEPTVLVAVNPTRGLDFASARTVSDSIRQAAAEGCGVLLISTDLDEVMQLSDRIQVLFDGTLTRPFLPPFDRHALGLAMARG